AVRAGRKVSKSFTAACFGLWWYAVKPNAAVYVVSNSELQSERVIWKTIKQLHAQSQRGPKPLDGIVNLRSQFGVASDTLATRSIQSLNPGSPVGFAGLSGVDQLFLIDEGSGLPDDHFAAVAGNCLGGGTIGAFSNPTESNGWFADIWLDEKKGERWRK